MLRLPDPSLIVLVGAAGTGKSTWAAASFRANSVVSTDAMRAVVGRDEHDQRASKDAFDIVERIAAARLQRGFATVIDSTALEAKQRRRWVEIARRHGVPVHAVVLEVDEKVVRSRNRARPRPVPSAVVTKQLAALAATRASIDGEGFDGVHHVAEDAAVELVPRRFFAAPEAARRQQEAPMPLRFALHLGRFDWPGGAARLPEHLKRIGADAEEAGFVAISVMDHVVQIPQVGPEWEDIPESTTVLGFLAAATSRVRLGALVNGITYRNLAQLGKQVATLDVLSGGRAACGLGVAWHQREHQLYGWEFPPVPRRYELLEDALELLPLLWGPGAPRFEGRTVTVAEAICYPRPIQERIPILVGGSGERRTLRLAAQHADACNLFGEPDEVRHKVEVLRRHCADVGRDPAEVAVTQLTVAEVVGTGADRTWEGRATIEEHVGRFRALAEAGVDEVFVALPGIDEAGTTSQIERFAQVIAAFA